MSRETHSAMSTANVPEKSQKSKLSPKLDTLYYLKCPFSTTKKKIYYRKEKWEEDAALENYSELIQIIDLGRI